SGCGVLALQQLFPARCTRAAAFRDGDEAVMLVVIANLANLQNPLREATSTLDVLAQQARLNPKAIVNAHGFEPSPARSRVDPLHTCQLGSDNGSVYSIKNARRRNDVALRRLASILTIKPQRIIVTHSPSKVTDCITRD